MIFILIVCAHIVMVGFLGLILANIIIEWDDNGPV